MFHCNICSSHQPAILEHEVSKIGHYLVIQLKRFLCFDRSVTKDIKYVKCSSTLSVPITVDTDVVCHKRFKLIATINHSGNLNSGHYTAFTSNECSVWFHCNDSAVIKVPMSTVWWPISAIYPLIISIA